MKFDPERVVGLARVLARDADDAHHALEKLIEANPDDENISWIGEHVMLLFTHSRELVSYLEGGACCCKAYEYPACDNVVSKMQELVQEHGPYCEFCQPVMEPLGDFGRDSPYEALELAKVRNNKRYFEKAQEAWGRLTTEEEVARVAETRAYWARVDAKRKKRLQELRDESEALEFEEALKKGSL